MGWISIENLIKLHSALLIHQVINTHQPMYIYQNLVLKLYQPPLPTRSNNIKKKLGPKPNEIGRSNYTKNTFMSQAYGLYNTLPDILTAISNKKYFKKNIEDF